MTRQTKRLVVVALLGLAGLALGRVLPWQELAAPWVEADSDGLIARAFAQGNLPPVADAGFDRSAAVGDTVVLDGSGSVDPKGALIDFTWTLTSAPGASYAALDDATAVKPSLTLAEGRRRHPNCFLVGYHRPSQCCEG